MNKILLNSIKKISVSIVLISFVFGCGQIEKLASIEDINALNSTDTIALRQYDNTKLALPPVLEYLVDPGSIESLKLSGHIKKLADYSKLPLQVTNLKEWNANPQIPESVKTLCLFDTKKITQNNIEKIVEFVAKGGNLFLPFNGEDVRFGYLIGLKPKREFETDILAKGYHFTSDFLPGMKGKTCRSAMQFYGFDRSCFTDQITILANAINNPNYPSIIKNTIGKGSVIFINTTGFMDKMDRGMLFAGLMHGLEGIPYPIVNSSTIFLDDFPSPLYDIKNEPIASEMNLNIQDFVKKAWWPDMSKIAQKFGISYSAMTTFDYSENTEPPFLFKQWDNKKIKDGNKNIYITDWFMNDVKKNNHELAFHGYNHVSLMEHDWKNKDFIVTALKTAEKKWLVNNYGPLPVTYVPPSNFIDRMGMKQLQKGMPSLKFLCSLYLGETADGGNREFDYDIYAPKMFDYPRISSGFFFDHNHEYAIQSMYLYTGIWTHFVHPDDVYQIADESNISQGIFDLRNPKGLGWRKTNGTNESLSNDFIKYLTSQKKLYPLMRFLNTREGAVITNDWRASVFTHKQNNDTYTVEKINQDLSAFKEQYWFVYGSQQNATQIENSLKEQNLKYTKANFQEGYLFNVYTRVPRLSIANVEKKNETLQASVQAEIQKAKQELRQYLIDLYKKESDTENDVDYDEQHRKEMILLKNKMVSEEKIDVTTWNLYAKYMSWEDRGEEVWKMLEEHCLKHPKAENILYSKQLSTIIDYPNDLVKEKWMSAQMLVTPNDKDLLNSYVANFYTPENQEKIKTALLALLKIDTSKESYLKYLEYLLEFEPKNALIELEKVTPSEEYASLATAITWLYADNETYDKAMQWSKFSKEIDDYTRMTWLLEQKDYKNLEALYQKAITENPENYKAKALMSSVYHETGRFKEAWILANSLPEMDEKIPLRETFNTDVVYEEHAVKQYLIEHEKELFFPDVLESLIKTERKEYGDYIKLDSELQTNREDPSAFKNVLSYNFYDKKLNLHSIGATYAKMYDIKGFKDLKDNILHNLYGIQYQFNLANRPEKLNYWARSRVEYSDNGAVFFHYGMGATLSSQTTFNSAEFKIYPAETGPAYSKSIYRFQLNFYRDMYFFGFLNTSISLEGNFYNKSKTQQTNYTTDDSFEGSITTKISLDNPDEKTYKIIPFVEASKSQGALGKSTIPLASGYPYWMLDDRLFYGGGVGFKLGKSTDNFRLNVEGTYFIDDYSDDFQRILGGIEYQLFDYTSITTNLEMYIQSKYYSNVIQFGIKHNLKKKTSKSKKGID